MATGTQAVQPGKLENPPPRTLVPAGAPAIALMLVAGAVFLFLFWYVAHVLLLIFAGILFAILLDAMMRPLMHVGVPRTAALLLAMALLFAIVTGFTTLFGSQIIAQLGQLRDSIDDQFRWLQTQAEGAGLVKFFQSDGQSLIRMLPDPKAVMGQTASAALSTFGALANALILIMIGAFIAAEPGAYQRGLVRLFPQHLRGKANEMLGDAGHVLRNWLLGVAVNMAVIFVLGWLGLTLLGVPQALILALFAALLAFIPNLGPLIAMIPIAVSAMTVGTTTLLWALALYAGIQALESNVLTPLVQKQAVRLFPAFILGVQLLMATLFGILGLAIATPLAAVLVAMWKDV